MNEWYLRRIKQCFEEWCNLIQINPKQALSKMQDIRNYRTMLNQRSQSYY